MTDTGAHPGVRSLLARFENNNQSSSTSPAPRGRSPIPSDNQGTGQPLSKVRASFISVDKTSHGSLVPELRTASSPIDGPSRVRSFNSEDFEAALKSPVSSSPSTGQEVADIAVTDQSAKDPSSTNNVHKKQAPPSSDSSGAKSIESATSKTKGQPNSRASAETAGAQSPQKPTKTVTKRPSNINVGRTTATTKSSPTISQRSPGQSRPPTSPTKLGTDKFSKLTSSTKSTVTKNGNLEPTRTATHKPSRTTLNAATKTATRPVRSSMPARESTRPTTSSAGVGNGHSKSPVRSARLPASRTTSALSTAAKSGSAHTLTRKPSTLKKTVDGSQSRATTPTAASIRKQASRPSLPSSSGSDRPHSRASNGSTKPADDSFLARMMRPTASSASKVHDKVEVKSPPSATRTTRAPRKAPSKIDPRSAHRLMEKTGQGKTQENKPQTAPAERTASKKELQAAAPLPEETENQHDVKPQAEVSDELLECTPDIVVRPHEESAESVATGIAEDSVAASAEPSIAPASEVPVEESAALQADEPVEQPLEAIPEQPLDVDESKPQEHIASVPDSVVPEAAEAQPETPSSPETEVAKEPVSLDIPVESVPAASPELPTEVLSSETEPKPEDVANEMEKLTIN
ncbi:uncharacterized protein ACLA_081550 [Aspergillus clavatus NRRL 1]|uniref:Mucin-7 n=1 Tax=Aspergillus clavatus (strain ATCC 1007 / CBS 513.65 / DSM 816 / NCTC 3887 / NRRL 1 / QM 1276 / 107) TaxID=344612 RepID=A1CT28_ASPCL|nr:uncharacterized protein ACLA_081550 [Aspergillus clavatus NRRL 1]EAW06465.1 conserved hypothetical protein [Aspergillus clavatus NRRL 1]